MTNTTHRTSLSMTIAKQEMVVIDVDRRGVEWVRRETRQEKGNSYLSSSYESSEHVVPPILQLSLSLL